MKYTDFFTPEEISKMSPDFVRLLEHIDTRFEATEKKLDRLNDNTKRHLNECSN